MQYFYLCCIFKVNTCISKWKNLSCRNNAGWEIIEPAKNCMSTMEGVCLASVCYTGDRDTAQDLLHDGFIKIFSSFDKFTWRGEGSLRAWMERVMVNTALQYLRKSDVISQSTPLEEVPEDYEEPDASAVEMIPQAVLMRFIEELPAGYRTVFNLYTFEEKSHKEIAQLLGINEKSSASQLFRAKSVLAKRVKEWIMNNG